MCGTPGSAKAGPVRIFAESGFEIWGWSFMAFSPIASPILPQAGPSRHRSERIAMRTIWSAAWNDEEIWMSWTDERIEQLRNMWETGLTARQIADELARVSRTAEIGTAIRLGTSSRHLTSV